MRGAAGRRRDAVAVGGCLLASQAVLTLLRNPAEQRQSAGQAATVTTSSQAMVRRAETPWNCAAESGSVPKQSSSPLPEPVPAAPEPKPSRPAPPACAPSSLKPPAKASVWLSPSVWPRPAISTLPAAAPTHPASAATSSNAPTTPKNAPTAPPPPAASTPRISPTASTKQRRRHLSRPPMARRKRAHPPRRPHHPPRDPHLAPPLTSTARGPCSPLRLKTADQHGAWQSLVAMLEEPLGLHAHRRGTLLKLSAYLHDRTRGMNRQPVPPRPRSSAGRRPRRGKDPPGLADGSTSTRARSSRTFRRTPAPDPDRETNLVITPGPCPLHHSRPRRDGFRPASSGSSLTRCGRGGQPPRGTCVPARTAIDSFQLEGALATSWPLSLSSCPRTAPAGFESRVCTVSATAQTASTR